VVRVEAEEVVHFLGVEAAAHGGLVRPEVAEVEY
jgi:hypothetical protein